jgi:hypothetical protein
VQNLARQRLALCQLDLANPQHRGEIERLIGSAAYAVLRLDAARPPRFRALVRCLEVLDMLDPYPPANRERPGEENAR